MKFIPFSGKVEIKPINAQSVIKSEDAAAFIQAGEVVAVGDGVTFVNIGDRIYFDSYGCSKTPELDGVVHYVVDVVQAVILGKDGE